MTNPTGSMNLSQAYVKGEIILPAAAENQIEVTEGALMIPSEGLYDRTERPLHVDGRSLTPPTPPTGVKYFVILQGNVSIVDEVTGPLAGLITTKYDTTDYPEADSENQTIGKFIYDENMPVR